MKPSWLNEEQIQLRDILNQLRADDELTAARLADVGALGALVPVAYGGSGFGLVEATIIAEALGRARSTVPFIEAAVIAGGLIANLGSTEQCERWLPKIVDGTLKVSIAFAEQLHFDVLAPSAQSRRCTDGFELEGSKAPAVGAPGADVILINTRGAGGISLHAVPAANLTLSASYETVDGLQAATIDLSRCKVSADTLLGQEGGAAHALDEVIEQALVVQAAEQIGIMAHLIESTVAYLKERRQFGVPLSSFQVLRHRVADMLLHYEKAGAMLAKARLQAAAPLTAARHRAYLGAGVMATNGALSVGHAAIQLHGGMGITEELSIGPTVKRIYALETRLGAIESKIARYAKERYGA